MSTKRKYNWNKRLKNRERPHPFESGYCQHGTYVGNWGTADYLCGPCEDGVSDKEYFGARKYRRRRQRYNDNKAREIMKKLIANPGKRDYYLNRLIKYTEYGYDPVRDLWPKFREARKRYEAEHPEEAPSTWHPEKASAC